jgi:hypothetical protein
MFLYRLIFILLFVLISCSTLEKNDTNNTKLLNNLVENCDEFIDNYHDFNDREQIDQIKNKCIRYYIKEALHNWHNSNGLEFLNIALSLDSANQEIFFWIAQLYDDNDSISKAKFYYNKINSKSIEIYDPFSKKVKLVEIEELKQKYFIADSIKKIFLDSPDDCYFKLDYYSENKIGIMDFIMMNNYSIYRYFRSLSSIFGNDIKCKINGNGNFEVCNYFDMEGKREKKIIKGKFPKEILNHLLDIIEDSKFINLNNILDENNKFFFNVDIPDCPFDRICLHTPFFDHSIRVYGLHRNPYSSDKDIQYNRLIKLSELWIFLMGTNDGKSYSNSNNLLPYENKK